MKPRRLFVDANAIIGSFGVYEGQGHLWTALCRSFSVETVVECAEETQRGDPHKDGYISVPPHELDLVKNHEPSQAAVAAFGDLGDLPGLGLGEAHLLAWLYFEASSPPAGPGGHRVLPVSLLIATADSFALRALHQLGWLQDHVVSLEWLAGQVGIDFPTPEQIPRRHRHQVEAWLQRRKMLLRG